jgi:hypothetical protein
LLLTTKRFNGDLLMRLAFIGKPLERKILQSGGTTSDIACAARLVQI